MKLFQITIVEDVALTGNYTSPSQVVQITEGAIQAVWTGADLEGNLKLTISNDDIIYTDYTGSNQAVSGPGDVMWILDVAQYQWFKVVFEYISGTGNLESIKYNSKGLFP